MRLGWTEAPLAALVRGAVLLVMPSSICVAGVSRVTCTAGKSACCCQPTTTKALSWRALRLLLLSIMCPQCQVGAISICGCREALPGDQRPDSAGPSDRVPASSNGCTGRSARGTLMLHTGRVAARPC